MELIASRALFSNGVKDLLTESWSLMSREVRSVEQLNLSLPAKDGVEVDHRFHWKWIETGLSQMPDSLPYCPASRWLARSGSVEFPG